MNSPLQNAALFLIDTISMLYIYALLLRIILQVARVSFHNPFSQFIVTVTNPGLVQLRRFIPAFGGHDIAAYLLVLIVQLLTSVIKIYITVGSISLAPNFIGGLGIISIAYVIQHVISLYIFLVIMSIVLSWVSPMNFVSGILVQLTAPLLRPIQDKVPPIGVFDLSPLVLLVGLQLINILVADPLIGYGATVAG